MFVTLTTGILKRGLIGMVRPRPAAILFGLETGLEAERVITLTWQKVKPSNLTPYAIHILDSQPRHIHCQYVFWQNYKSSNKPLPLFGLSEEVFSAFGIAWGELAVAYKHIIFIDEDEELDRFAPEIAKQISTQAV
jgi:hypothetical protein